MLLGSSYAVHWLLRCPHMLCCSVEGDISASRRCLALRKLRCNTGGNAAVCQLADGWGPVAGVGSLTGCCALTWTFLITPAHLGLSGALDCNRGVCSLSVRCALTWTCLITPAHLGLSGALGRSRGACSLTGGVCRRWDAPHPKSLRGVVCGPQKPKRLNADENCQKLFSSRAPSWVVCEPQNPKRLNADQKSVKL